VSKEDKRDIGASILSLCCLSVDIWLLVREPMHLGVLRVDLTNSRDQLGGERSHPNWSKISHRDEIFLPQHFASYLFSHRWILHQPQVPKGRGMHH